VPPSTETLAASRSAAAIEPRAGNGTTPLPADAGDFGDIPVPPEPRPYAAYVYGSIGEQNQIRTTGLLFHAVPGLVVSAGIAAGATSSTTFLGGSSRIDTLGATTRAF
jgi:hypothetical protein